MKLCVESVLHETASVVRYVLRAVGGGLLRGFTPGSHIAMHLRLNDGRHVVRCYSLLNYVAQGEAVHSYEIGVLLQPNGSGGSRHIHENFEIGHLVDAEAPRNHFPIEEAASRHVLIAGGIGITPLLSMATALSLSCQKSELHYFCHDDRSAAFASDLRALTAIDVHVDAGLSRACIRQRIGALFLNEDPNTHFYVCGPAGLIETVQQLARDRSWPPHHVHFERFEVDQGSSPAQPFEVRLAASGRVLKVPANETLLEALRSANVPISSSCGTGVCGTCLVTVLEGEIDHRDDFLLEEDRESGTLMCACVSRSKSPQLVLQL